MKNIKVLLMIVGLGFLAGYFGHWLASVILVSVPVYFMKVKPGAAALLGFIAIFLLWAGYALLISHGNQNLLASRVGQLMGGLSPLMVGLLSGLIGGIGGALWGWSTALIQNNLMNMK